MIRGVDESFLTKQETEELGWIGRRPSSHASMGELLRDSSAVLFVASIVSGFLGVMLLVPTNGGGIAFGLAGLSVVLILLWAWFAVRAWRRKEIEMYLVRIGYEERVRSGVMPVESAPHSPGHNDVSGSMRRMQHHWYEGHSELDWRDRQRAELYGIDVETYINNVLEDDRD